MEDRTDVREVDNTELKINQAMAMYIENVFRVVPSMESGLDQHNKPDGRRTKEYILYKSPTLDSVEFFTINESSKPMFGMHVYFRGDVPENVIQYPSETGVHTVKKIDARFRFTKSGEADAGPEFYDLADKTFSSSKDSRNMSERQREIADMHVDVNSDEARERMVIYKNGPGEDNPDMPYGGALILVKHSKQWFELEGNALEQLHKEYPEQFPDPNEFFESLSTNETVSTE